MHANTIKYIVKQYMKMLMQGFFLPVIYQLYRHIPVQSHRVVFADAHHENLPFSMQAMHQTMKEKGYEVIDFLYDSGRISTLRQIVFMIRFMKLYASARYVFLCDYFLPAASCRKKKETMLIQLWHSGGLLKTMGFAASEDIPAFYKLNPHKNYDLVTVSAPCCIPIFVSSMHLPKSVIQATGISRSDLYFNSKFLTNCREHFYTLYPEARDKNILLWAPTFRGTAGSPYLVGTEDIRNLQKELGDKWLVLIKAHPYIDQKSLVSNCKIPTEQLLPIVDLLITDYSSVLFDYLLLEKPFILFAPDYAIYSKTRGFYLEYDSLPGPIVIEGNKLAYTVWDTLQNPPKEALRKNRQFHMGCCDGQATQRIWSWIQENSEARRITEC